VDCYDWCPGMKSSCGGLIDDYCRKTCDSCVTSKVEGVCAPCDQKCVLDESSTGLDHCECFDGFRMAANGTCLDINECDEGAICPSDTPVCVNKAGSYQCNGECSKTENQNSYYGNEQKCCENDVDSACGLSEVNHIVRIVNGTDSKLGYWPWQAYLAFEPESLCGGTLINDEWVLTAAHCFDQTNSRLKGVFLGGDDVSDKQNIHVQTFTHKQIIVHADYNYPYNDVALVQLDRPIKKSKFVRPACLPNGETPPAGTKCFATGFGTIRKRLPFLSEDRKLINVFYEKVNVVSASNFASSCYKLFEHDNHIHTSVRVRMFT